MLHSRTIHQLQSSWPSSSEPTASSSNRTSDIVATEFYQKIGAPLPLWIRESVVASEDDKPHHRSSTARAWSIAPCSIAESSRSELQENSIAPVGVGQLSYRFTPPFCSISSFAALELACCDIHSDSENADSHLLNTLAVQWPVDVEKPAQMLNKTIALRALYDHPISIGIAIPIAETKDSFFESMNWLSECMFDWITWRLPAACLGKDHPALPCFVQDPLEVLSSVIDWQSSTFLKNNSRPAIAIEFPWESGYHAGRILEAGADVVVLPSTRQYANQSIERLSKERGHLSSGSGGGTHSAFGSSLNYPSSSFSHGMPFAFANGAKSTSTESTEVDQSNSQSLEDFVSQLIAFIEWSQ